MEHVLVFKCWFWYSVVSNCQVSELMSPYSPCGSQMNWPQKVDLCTARSVPETWGTQHETSKAQTVVAIFLI